MSKIIPIYDSGHGYDTPGKRSSFHFNKEGKALLKENSFNEAVANKLSMIYSLNNKECHFISSEWWDISLDERVRRERTIYRDVAQRGGKSIFISIHADAFGETKAEGAKAAGATFFYKSNSGKKLAEHFTRIFKDSTYPIPIREPKYANFKVLRKTSSPAILFEAGFMTNWNDLQELLKDSTRNVAASLLYKATEEL